MLKLGRYFVNVHRPDHTSIGSDSAIRNKSFQYEPYEDCPYTYAVWTHVVRWFGLQQILSSNSISTVYRWWKSAERFVVRNKNQLLMVWWWIFGGISGRSEIDELSARIQGSCWWRVPNQRRFSYSSGGHQSKNEFLTICPSGFFVVCFCDFIA